MNNLPSVLLAFALSFLFASPSLASPSPPPPGAVAERLAADIATPFHDMYFAHMLEILDASFRQNPSLAAVRIRDLLLDEIAVVFWRDGDQRRHLPNSDFPGNFPLPPISFATDVLKDGRRIGVLESFFVDPLGLSPAELDFLRNRPVLRAAAVDFPPFSSCANGNCVGFSPALFRILAQQLGVRAEFVPASFWNDAVSLLLSGEVDVVPLLSKFSASGQSLLFTAPYARFQSALFFPRDRAPQSRSLSGLSGLRVAAVLGSPEEALLRNRPGLSLVAFSNLSAAAAAAASGSADAFAADQNAGDFALRKLGSPSLFPAFPIDDPSFSPDVHFATRADLPILRNLLQRSLAALPDRELVDLSSRWLAQPAPRPASGVFLTPEEEAYLASRGPVRMCVDPDYAPFETIDSRGHHAGIVPELLALVQQRVPVRFELVPTDSWTESLKLARNRQCDVLSFLNETPARSEFLSFTPTLYGEPEVIVARHDVAFLKGYESLHGRKVGMVRGWRGDEFIRLHHPQIELVYASNFEESLERVSSGEIFATIGTLGSAVHSISQLRLANVRIAGDALYLNEYRIGVRNDDPLLLSILSKGVASLSKQEVDEIVSRHVSVTYARDFNLALVVNVALVFLAVVAAFFFRNRSLRRFNASLAAAKSRAESANLAKSEFIANLGHEFRTPLNSIIGFSDLLSAQIPDPRLRSHALTISASGKSLLRLLGDVLDLSKIESGSFEMRPAPASLLQMLDDVRLLFAPRAAEKGLSLSFSAASDLPESVLLDVPRLRQILSSLVDNAVKFTPSGSVDVRARCSRRRLGFDRCDLFFDVADSGPGIPDDFKELVFGAFDQIPGQDHAKYRGTGLGLALSRRLASLMNGSLSVADNPDGRGSLFSLSLRDVAFYPDSALPSPPSSDFSARVLFSEKPRLLVVDDSPVNRDLLKSILAPHGFPVAEASDGRAALALCSSLSPRIVFVDLVMPVMNGREFAHALRSRLAADSSVAIVAVGASSAANFSDADFRDFDGFLRKPVDSSSLLHLLARFVPHVLKPASAPPSAPPPIPPPATPAPSSAPCRPNCLPKLPPSAKTCASPKSNPSPPKSRPPAFLHPPPTSSASPTLSSAPQSLSTSMPSNPSSPPSILPRPDLRSMPPRLPALLFAALALAASATAADPLLLLALDDSSGTNALDSSSAALHAQLRSGAEWISTGSPRSPAAAIRFDGAGAHLLAPSFPYPDAFVLSFWFRCFDNSGDSYQYIFSHGLSGESNSLSVYLGEDQCSSTNARNVLRTSLRESNSPSYFAADVPGVLADGQWRLYRLEARSDGLLRVFLDGELRASASRAGSGPFSPATPLFLGGRHDLSPSRFFRGDLDLVSLRPWPDASGAFYVSPDGWNGDDGSSNRPWQSLSHAVLMLNPGDSALLRSGTYPGRVRASLSGAAFPGATNWIVIAAAPGESPVLDGASESFQWGGLLDLSSCRFLRVSDLEIVDSPQAAISVQDSSDVQILHNRTLRSGSSGVYVSGSSRVLVGGNVVRAACNGSPSAQECITVAGHSSQIDVCSNLVHDGVGLYAGGEGICVKGGANAVRVFANRVFDLPGEVGIYVGAVTTDTANVEVSANRVSAAIGIGVASEGGAFVSDVRILANLVHDCPYDGIVVPSWLADGPRSNLLVAHNTVVACGRSNGYGGISVRSSNLLDVRVLNNLCASNGSWQILVKTGAVPHSVVSRNLVFPFRGAFPEESRGLFPVEADPAFLDPPSADFRLKFASPAIAAGSSVPEVLRDFLAQPISSPPDLGAFQYDPSSTDSDFDSIPDSWEIAASLSPLDPLDALDDPDSDLASNLHEYLADTDPRNPSSFLRLLPSSDGQIRWSGGALSLQILERTPSLSPPAWLPLHTNLPPTPATNSFPAPPGFYRLRAQRADPP